ncbi:MAG: TIR domain-containing protein, partial [Rhodothermaceae bacterium]|nr:TIR domain-containing protein [Rhodothermaceae bacterium]
MPRFFISYRRKDSQQIVGRIYEKLTDYFGDDAVFLDVDDIPTGSNFREHILKMVVGSDAMIVIMGGVWLGSFSGRDPGRLDHVLIELEVALEQGVPMIPVLIGQTRMPDEKELPASISQVSFRNAFSLDIGGGFDRDITRLINHLDTLRIGQGQRHRHQADYRLVHQSCKAVLEVFRSSFPVEDQVFGVNMRFLIYSTNEFRLPMNTGISLFLHRIMQDSTSLIELHLIVTAWGFNANVQHLIIGWVVEYLKRNPILPIEKLSDAGLDAIPP